MHDELILKIETEINQIELLIDTHKIFIELCKNKNPDTTEIAAIGSILHSFYNGIEKILVFIAKGYDLFVPKGEKWHRDLIKQMNTITEKRNKILSDDIVETILNYMGFRHFFRHSYDFQLDWDLLKTNFINDSPEKSIIVDVLT